MLSSDDSVVESLGSDIAIIGMAGRFPGAETIHQFWKNLVLGEESLTWHAPFEEKLRDKDTWHVPATFDLNDMDKFDEKFFKFSPKEAAVTDPQQRLLLQCAWQALEDAGYAATREQAEIGVFVSTGLNTYFQNQVGKNSRVLETTDPIVLQIGNDKDYAASRISYKLNLRGPSAVVQSACSSSLLGVHMGVQALCARECNLALVGGMSLETSDRKGYSYMPGSIFSKDGHCKPFSDGSSGTVRGSGGAVVVLKRFKEALADQDLIYGVIRGSATNNDGARKVGFAAPSVEGQAEVIRRALAVAHLSPDSIGYIEAHGTGTPLGDPIEIAALTQVFSSRSKNQKCLIGSVKSNIGHLDAGAGIAGLIKATLCAFHGYIPKTLHFTKPNPNIDFENSPFEVAHQSAVWTSKTPRRAGVSSFGIGGSNVHVIVEEPPRISPELKKSAGLTSKPVILNFSAKSDSALHAFADSLAYYCEENSDLTLEQIQSALNRGREHFNHRMAVVADCLSSAASQLRERGVNSIQGIFEGDELELTFMFPGQGTPFRGMAAGYYQEGQVFRNTFDQIAHLAVPLIGLDLKEAVFNPESTFDLSETWLSQIALFAVEYSLAKHWISAGLKPQSMIGHSIGEYVAAALAGVFELKDCIRVVVARGALMQKMANGKMLAIRDEIETVQAHLPDSVSIAAINQPELIVVSGPADAIQRFQTELEEKSIACRPLETSHAFHSWMMEPCLEEFARVLGEVRLSPPVIPFVSNLSGCWITSEQAQSVDYWVQHLRSTVRFSDGISTLIEQAPQCFIECGPGKSLSTAAKEISRRFESPSQVISLCPNPTHRIEITSEPVRVEAQLWCFGFPLKNQNFAMGTQISPPPYCFDKTKHWVEPDPQDGIIELGSRKPERDPADASSGRPDAAALTLHEKIARLWSEALGVPEISFDSNFFDLGGDSILSIKITHSSRKIGIPLEPSRLLEFPTVNRLCEFLQKEGFQGAQDPHDQQGNQPMQSKKEIEDEREAVRRAYQPAPEDRFKPFPLTDIQHAYWLGKNLENLSAHAYEEFECHHLDVSRLEHALNSLIRRHDMLRAVATEEGLQRVLPDVPKYSIQTYCFRNLLPLLAEKELSKVRESMSFQMIRSDRWPLFDLRVSHLPDGTSRLHISFELLIMDAWSITLFWRELEACYHDPAWKPEPLSITFRDYVLAEKKLKEEPSFAKAKQYWLDRADGFPLAPALPHICNPDQLSSSRFSRLDTQIDKQVWKKLKTVASKKGLTPSSVLCAAYTEVLATRSESSHFCLNLPAFNRLDVDPDIDQVMGDFTSVLLLEADLRADISFRERVTATQKRLWSDISAIQYNGVEFLKELAKREDARVTMPYIFTSLLFPQNQDRPIVSRLGRLVNGISQSPHVWLDCQVYEENENLIINWDYLDDLFDPQMLQEMFLDYRALLSRLADEEDLWEKTHWRDEWADRYVSGAIGEANQTDKAFDQILLHEGFLEQVKKTPHAIAVTGDVVLDYNSLNRMSANLASKLSDINRLGDRVGILAPKGWQQVVAALAILRMGGAYIPLSVDLPPERLYSIIESAGIKVVITVEDLDTSTVWPFGVYPLLVNPSDLELECEWVDLPIDPDSLAYVIFTSGSMGKPKGVMITHRASANTIADVNSRFSVTNEDRIFALSSLGFDLSVYDIFGPLSVGGAVVIPSAEIEKDPAHWLEMVQKHRVTIWNSVPALVDLFVNHLEVENFSNDSIRLVMMSGDWISKTLPARINRYLPRALPVSLGGATEASIWSIFHVIESVNPGLASIPYGKALANQKVYVLDSHLRVRPKSVVGEIFIAGKGVATGYLNNPEETRYRFVPQPRSGERLYRTGDLGRWLPDGSIEFLGRKDTQIKINGFRIETGEIEKVILEQLNVRSCMVLPLKEKGVVSLILYVQPETGPIVNIETVRNSLRKTLPSYMIPREIIILDRMPLSSNGKIDLKNLTLRETQSDAKKQSPAETQTARILMDMIRQVSQIEVASIDADLYQQGLDSRLLTELVSHIRRKFSKTFRLRKVFEKPTVRGISEAIDEMMERQEDISGVSSIAKNPRTSIWPLSSAQMRLWFHDQIHPQSTTYNLVYVFRFRGGLDTERLIKAFEIFVGRHRILTSQIVEVDGDAFMKVVPGLGLRVSRETLPSGDLTDQLLTDQLLKERIAQETHRPFDFEEGGLFRISLLSLFPEDHVLIVSSHHIIWDGWSTAIMIREVSSLFSELAQSEKLDSIKNINPNGDSKKDVLEYSDYAIWELNQQKSPLIQEQLTYWKNQLKAPLPTLALPVEQVTAVEEPGARQAFLISSELAKKFEFYCMKEGITPFMGYLATYQALLNWWCNQDDIIVGTPVGHRARPELTEMVGYIVNNLAIRTRINVENSFKELCRQVKLTCLDAYSHQDVPFDQVVKAIQPKRRQTESAPVYRAWFVLDDIPSPLWDLGKDVKTEGLDAEFLLDVHDIKLSLVSGPEGVEGGLDYRTPLFTKATIHCLSTLFVWLIEHLVANPEIKIAQLRKELNRVHQELTLIPETQPQPKWIFNRTRRPNAGGVES